MIRREPPANLAALIERVRRDPSIFYGRSISDQKFLLSRVCTWLDTCFPKHPGILHRERMMRLNLTAKIRLESKVLRFVKNVIFYPENRTESVTPTEWHMYAAVREF